MASARRRRRAPPSRGAWILLALLPGCQDGPVGPVSAAAVTAVSEAALTARAGDAPTVRVRVTDGGGAPLPGARVAFIPAPGSGAADPASVTTGPDGSAATSWTLGTVPGDQRLRAVVEGIALDFAATVRPGDPSALETAATALEGPAGRDLPEPVEVVVRDRFGNPVPGVPVSFTVTGGGVLQVAHPAPGSVTDVGAAAAITDAAGRAATRWILGPTAGPQTLEARSGDAPAVVLTALATPGEPHELAVLSGGWQSGPVGSLLPEPVLVRVRDVHGNAVSGVPVTMVVVSGGGSVAPGAGVTDDDGVLAALWTLGEVPGANVLEARIPGLEAASFHATASPGSPTAIRAVSGDGQTGAVGAPLSSPLVAAVVDAFGNGVSGVDVTFVVTEGGGTASPSTVRTGPDGRASAGWTLGGAVGPQTLQARVASLGSVAFTATAGPGSASSMTVIAGAGQEGPAGRPLPEPLVVELRDGFGNPVAGAPVTFTVTAGAGATLDPATPATDPAGRASTVLTLGPGAGPYSVKALSGGLSRSFAVTAVAGEAATLSVHAGDGQTGPAGSTLPVEPRVIARDAFGNPVPGVVVHFDVASGGGSVGAAAAATDAAGIAGAGSWTLGTSAGTNTLTASIDGLPSVTFTATGSGSPPQGGSGFTAELRFLGAATPSQQAVFASSAARWRSVITGDLPDAPVNLPAGACGVSHPAVSETVDDVLIWVEVVDIDGVGGVLGSAGPCLIRSGSKLTILGTITLDRADVNSMEASGILPDVVLHEMGHVLGIGTLWQTKGLLSGAGGADPHFTGARAVAEFSNVGGSAVNPVPVENTGGPGTRDGHWRESTMGNELMTGWISGSGNPLSRVTAASLEDLGYRVDVSAADGYAMAPPVPGAPPPLTLRLRERPTAPPMELTPDGPIRPER